jgi:hypothetical protein
MVVQTGALSAVLRQPVLAAPHRVEPSNDRQCTPQLRYVRVRSEVSCTGNVAFPGDEDSGEWLGQCEGDRRVALVVLEADVEAGPVLLDEVILEQQRPGLAGYHDGIDISDETLEKPVPGAVWKV